jgi:hypothetical protein
MKRFYDVAGLLNMPDIDYGTWGARAGVNPPGGMVGKTVASSATITPSGPVFHVSGTESITNIALPYTGFVGRVTIIADGAFTMTTGGTAGTAIATVVTAVASQAMDVVFDGTVWYPQIMD